MITGRFVSRKRRLFQALIGWAVLVLILLPLLLAGRMDPIEYRGLDWLHRSFHQSDRISPDIVILYIDQKSIDFFQKARGIGWPWPRDAYGLVVDFLKQGGAKAVVFDAVFSEPSVFNSDFGDDQAFAEAMQASGRVIQTLVLHEQPKGGAPSDEAALAVAAGHGLDYRHQAGPDPRVFADVTMPILPLAQSAWGLGFINVEPEADGVVRRSRLLAGLRDRVHPSLSLAAWLKLHDETMVSQTGPGLEAAGLTIPVDDEGMALIKYYGGLGAYEEYTIAAVIQSSVSLQSGGQPLLRPEQFKDKIVFIGAKAAALFDLRSTPMAEALPGVEIHAAFLNNLLNNDFLRRAPAILRGVLAGGLMLATLFAAVMTGSVLAGAAASLGLALLYLLAAVLAFRGDVWLDVVSPVAGLVAVFILATLVNYYGEGREKRAVKGAFSRYLSPHVVSQVLDHPEMLALGGTRRVMTAFFSDLAGFTSISESLSPENLVQLLNRYLNIMTRIIMDHGGTVDKFEGDAIMAFWGAPLPQEDHALRGCLAALDQQEAMARLRAEVLAEGLPELRVRMGLNTGPMIVGNMGSEERFDYTVMGDSVNLASRLEGANKAFGSEIMISEFTYEPVRGMVEVRELDLIRVKGKREPIRVYELLARAGQLPPEQEKTRAAFEEGLALYRELDFEKAEAAFLRALEIRPGDAPSGTYLERCRAYRDHPPPQGWDRVFTMTTK